MDSKGKTAAFGFVPILLIASMFGAYVALTTPSSSSLVSNPEYPLTASTTNSTTGLKLFLSINTSSIAYGDGINVTVGLLNVMKNKNLTLSLPASDWLPIAEGYCVEMYNIAIVPGYYTMTNVSSAKPVQRLDLFGVILAYCILQHGQLVLPPNGGYIRGPPFGLQHSSYLLNGYYPDSGSGVPPTVPFPLGTYTIVAGDGWSQLAMLHFRVATPRPFPSVVNSSSSFTVGSANFSNSSWQYAGNVTLGGSESVCYILRLPCPANPQNPAEEFVSAANDTVAYVETANGCGPLQGCITTTIALIDNSVYCGSPKSNIPSQPECPALID